LLHAFSWFGANAKHGSSPRHKQLQRGPVKATVPNLTGNSKVRNVAS
jgi:hypothetical protein